MSGKEKKKNTTPTDEELQAVIKVTSLAGAGCAFTASILAILATALPWWTGTASSQLLKVGLDGTETTISSVISLWSFDLVLNLAPEEGELEGREHRLTPTWADVCQTAERTMPVVPGECGNVVAAQACTILCCMLAAVSAGLVLVSRRFSNLLLLAAGACAILACFFALGGLFMGVLTSTAGLTGIGFIMLMAAMATSGLAVACIFYAATKALPPEPIVDSEGKASRLKRAQESYQKNADMIAQLEEGQKRKKQEREAQEAEGPKKKQPVMLKRVIFWSQENDGDEDVELPMELLEAAYQEIDEDGSGSLTLEELVDALKACGLNASQAAADNVMREIDKNMDGTIDIHEFVMFFRTLEEMNQFQKKTEQRAQFLVFICNFCFLTHIIVVGVLLMVFIRMDEASNPDNYTIMKNLLIAFSVVLCLLFMSVIAIPAARMTLGPSIAAWQYHYYKAMQNQGVKQISSGQNTQTGRSRGLRGAAWTEGAGEGPAAVNAAKYGASYRVTRMTYDKSADFAQGGMSQRPLSTPGSALESAGDMTASTLGGGAAQTATHNVPGAILSKTGEFLRYDPASFRTAAMSSMGARMPMSFTPMQVQNLGTSSDDPSMPQGMMAITDGGGPGSFYR
eukprot:TRINITY_DN61172_c0_g1_i1.p1 TRINITY_DN61172_c0_g1~~TRINITY_DN61172_c0_g1_i1.p1  ORF type:complete len:647 (-),score=150.09 TRINITY_DN61172_c0_g1_i1:105-1982(-)